MKRPKLLLWTLYPYLELSCKGTRASNMYAMSSQPTQFSRQRQASLWYATLSATDDSHEDPIAMRDLCGPFPLLEG